MDFNTNPTLTNNNPNVNINHANSNNMNKFNFNPNFIQPLNGYLFNYPQTPQNGVKTFNFPSNNLQNTFLPLTSNNRFIPIELKHANSSGFNNNMNAKASPTEVKFINREEPIDFKINLENIISGKDKRTTIMLRNIPNKYSLAILVEEINTLYLGKIDYINLPIDYEVIYIF